MHVEVSDGSLRIKVELDECPVLVVSASPSTTRVGARVAVTATASDPNPNDRLTYRWSAGAGSFDRATAPTTTYTCPGSDGAGPQDLTVAVSDGTCTVTRSATVSCLAAADGGPPGDAGDAGVGGVSGSHADGGGAGGSGAGAGSGAGGGGGVSCGGDPSLCEGELCNQCTFGVDQGHTDICTATASSCFNCSRETDGCAELPSDGDRTKCYALYTCIRDSGCWTSEEAVLPCWCGTAEFQACQLGVAVANGPCAAQIYAAAGTSKQATVTGLLANPNLPVGRAANLAGCRHNFCGKVADAQHPSCPLW